MRVSDAADQAGVALRLVGGIAVNLRCSSIRSVSPPRTYRDIDFCGRSAESKRIEALFENLGYAGNKRFNRLNGGERLIFEDPLRGRHVDVFIDVLRMCHDLDFRRRLTLIPRTLPVADLLLSKLQIVEMTERDILDTLAILGDQPLVNDNESGINLRRLAEVCGADWGWWRTITMNLERVSTVDGGPPGHDAAARLRKLLDGVPKSPRWRARAVIGDRRRWYELPEEVR
mgnify:CR=1 FL=1